MHDLPPPCVWLTQVDIFFVTYPDLGGIAEIDVEHDNSGMGPGWHLEQVSDVHGVCCVVDCWYLWRLWT
jgi:hypothetical protein